MDRKDCLDLTSAIWVLRASSSFYSVRKAKSLVLVLYGEGEESESQHMEGLLTLLQRQGYAGKPLGQREKRRREKR